jgi:hypothetical protein
MRPIAVAGNIRRSCDWYERRQRWWRDRCGPEPAGTYVLILDEEERAQFRAEAERRGVPWRPQPREDAAWRICVDPELPFGARIHSQDLIMLAEKAAAVLMRR